MKTIPVKHGHLAMVDDADYAWLSRYKWFLGGQCKKAKHGVIGYATTQIKDADGKPTLIKMDRMIMGKCAGKVIDHIDGNSLNNQRDNLQFLKHRDNLRKAGPSSRNVTGFRGVCPHSTRPGIFSVTAKINKRAYFVGNFNTPEEGASAYAEFMRGYWADPDGFNPVKGVRKNNVSSVVGISPKDGRWIVRRMRAGKSHYLGTFGTLEEAKTALEKFDHDHPRN